MKRRCFVPIESYVFASPEILLRGGRTDLGLLAEALVLFNQIDINVGNAKNLADILRGFKQTYGSINPFLDLVSSGMIRVHYFDFLSTAVEKTGVFSYWNIQDSISKESHLLSFQQKILYNPAIEEILPKARHRRRLYDVVIKSALIEAAEDYDKAIEAAREASKTHKDIELLLNSFKDSLPKDYQRIFPERIVVTANHEEQTGLTTHDFNFDFDDLCARLPNLNFKKHIPGVGLVQTYRIIYVSRRHNYDIYLPSPLSDVVLAKMESFSDQGKGFSKTVVDLTKKACFPDIRGSFNDGTIGWKDILEIRNKATRFREWFATNGGDPEVALETYGEEFKASTGLKGYRDKIFSIIKYGTTVVGAGVGHVINGGTSVASPVLGAIVGGMVPFVKDLIKASEEENWKPRFFGNWVHEKVLRKED